MKLKVCGMKYNTQEVAALQPNYLGFIFWEPSKRYFEGKIPQLPDGIKKIGVFVDATVAEVLDKIEKYDLWGVQLHGNETPEYCKKLMDNCHAEHVEAQSKGSQPLNLIKVFSIKDDFDFSALQPYEKVCSYYLFDTKGELPGGNGYAFDWEVLKNYPSTKPYFLGGGIGLAETESIKEFLKRPESKYCHVIDVNSKFEIKPGLKEVEKLKKFKKTLDSPLERGD